MKYVYKTKGTCSTNIELDVENGIVKEIAFWGGCNGNLQGISRLVTGMPVSEVITRLEGVRWRDSFYFMSRPTMPCFARDGFLKNKVCIRGKQSLCQLRT